MDIRVKLPEGVRLAAHIHLVRNQRPSGATPLLAVTKDFLRCDIPVVHKLQLEISVDNSHKHNYTYELFTLISTVTTEFAVDLGSTFVLV